DAPRRVRHCYGIVAAPAQRCNAIALHRVRIRRSGARSDPEQLLERAPGGRFGLGDGPLFRLVLRLREAMRRAAVKLAFERLLRSFQVVDHMAELDRIVRALGAVQDEKQALGILRPAGGVTAERAMDRDIGSERCAGRAELDAYRTAEAIADQSDA